MGLNTKVSGINNQICVTGEDTKFGVMVAYMKAIGKMTKLTVEED
jgi:hypothetical protein